VISLSMAFFNWIVDFYRSCCTWSVVSGCDWGESILWWGRLCGTLDDQSGLLWEYCEFLFIKFVYQKSAIQKESKIQQSASKLKTPNQKP